MFLIENDVKYYKLIFYIIFMLDWDTLRQNTSNQTTQSRHVWPQNEFKKSFGNILQFTSKKEQVIHRLSQIWINVSEEDFDFDPNLTDRELKEKHSPNETNIHIAPMLTTKSMFEMIWLDKDYFQSKKVTDIWWWFTALPFELKEIVSSLEIVDTCFGSDIERLIDIDITLLEKFILSDKKTLKEKNEYLAKLKLELDYYIDYYTPKWQSIFLDIEWKIIETKKIIDSFNKSLPRKTQVVDELKMWKEQIQQWNRVNNNLGLQNVHLNNSVWEDIKWIANESQDIVFINHLLTKGKVNPYLILAEASRIVKSGWEIIVVNDEPINLDPSGYSYIKIHNDKDKHKIWFRLIKK